MKNFKLKKLLGLALIGGASVLSASTVFAAAGDSITNTATLGYTVSGVPQTDVPSNTVEFWEDRKINFVVAEVGGATTSVVPGGNAQVQTFTVTNLGNDTQDFLLTALNRTTAPVTVDPHSVVNDSFDATGVLVYVDSNATGVPAGDVYDGPDVALFIDNLAPGDIRTVYIVSDIPIGATNNEVAVMSLVAQVADGAGTGIAADAIMGDDNSHVSPAGLFSNGAQDTTGQVVAAATNVNGALTVETVFADAAGDIDSAGLVGGAASNGQHADSDSYTIAAAVLAVNKTVVPFWDPINGNTSPKSIPGAYVQYTITISNAGPAAGVLTTLSDTLSASLDLDPNLILAGATTPVPTANVDAESGADGNAIRIDTSAAGAGAGTARPSAGVTYCTGDVGDADTDGCSYAGGAGVALSVVLSHAVNASVAGMGAEVGYLEGELLSGESIDIVFNAIVQ